MARASIDVSFHFAWWLQPYLDALVFFALLTQREPDWSKVSRAVNLALVVHVDGHRMRKRSRLLDWFFGLYCDRVDGRWVPFWAPHDWDGR